MKFWQFAMLMSAVYIAPDLSEGFRFGAGVAWFLFATADAFNEWRK